jgi:hypothetical protein
LRLNSKLSLTTGFAVRTIRPVDTWNPNLRFPTAAVRVYASVQQALIDVGRTLRADTGAAAAAASLSVLPRESLRRISENQPSLAALSRPYPRNKRGINRDV